VTEAPSRSAAVKPSEFTLSPAQARRIALAAQGFGAARGTRKPGTATPSVRQIRSVIDRMGVLQLDSVNVLCRSHYLPVYSRIGPYSRSQLDGLAAHTTRSTNRAYIEYWAHEASLIPLTTFPLLKWRMDRANTDAWAGVRRLAAERPGLLDDVRELVAAQGPIRSNQTGIERAPRRPGAMWNWHDGKIALEYLFYAGEIGAARRINFERHYDLIERIVPPELLAEAHTIEVADAQRALLRIAARAYGVATEPDLGDYFRLPRAESKARVAELVDAGELVPVTVHGWSAPAYLWPDARRPRALPARALLSPFDPLVWYRDRALRLFDFHYRIEIYTPAPKRRYGYYVLPFLLGDRIVARVDLKADRVAGRLLVRSAWQEPDIDVALVIAELAAELRQLADWLGLPEDIGEAASGDLAPALSSELASATQRGPAGDS
jgi:uncharacterized protein